MEFVTAVGVVVVVGVVVGVVVVVVGGGGAGRTGKLKSSPKLNWCPEEEGQCWKVGLEGDPPVPPSPSVYITTLGLQTT